MEGKFPKQTEEDPKTEVSGGFGYNYKPENPSNGLNPYENFGKDV